MLFFTEFSFLIIAKLPLGTLVNIFSKINSDPALHKSLREITRERNEVAHRSLLFTLGELSDEDYMVEATLKIKGIVEREQRRFIIMYWTPATRFNVP